MRACPVFESPLAKAIRARAERQEIAPYLLPAIFVGVFLQQLRIKILGAGEIASEKLDFCSHSLSAGIALKIRRAFLIEAACTGDVALQDL